MHILESRWGRAPAAFLLVMALLPAGPALAQPMVRIAAVGDSYASGEGAPDGFNGSNPVQEVRSCANLEGAPQRAVWRGSAPETPEAATDTSCHRSSHAWPPKVAEAFRGRTGKPVEFVSFACSGAEIPHLTTQAFKGVGTSECRDGVGGQLCEIEKRFKGKVIDALLVSIGGNDVGFGPTVMHCIARNDCPTRPVLNEGGSTDIEAGKRKLRERYRQLAETIERINSRGDTYISNVFLVEYPSPMTDERGQLCGHPGKKTGDAMDGIDQGEARWAAQVVIPALNGMVREGAGMIADSGGRKYGFYVAGTASSFQGHGYCASNRWLNLIRESLARQGDCSGAVHPNMQGHDAYRDVVVPALDRLLPPSRPEFLLTAALGTPATSFTPQGLRLAWRPGDTRATLFQVASRPVDVSGGAPALETPPQPGAEVLGFPPRRATADSKAHNGWSFDLTGVSRAQQVLPVPSFATDFSVRACTEAMCSPWSEPIRVAPVTGAEQVPRVQQVRAERPGLTTLRTLWQGRPSGPNAFYEVSYLRGVAGAQPSVSEVPTSQSSHLLTALAQGSYRVTVRECRWSIVSRQEKLGSVCGSWSDPVTVTLGVDSRATTPDRKLPEPAKRLDRPPLTRPHLPGH